MAVPNLGGSDSDSDEQEFFDARDPDDPSHPTTKPKSGRGTEVETDSSKESSPSADHTSAGLSCGSEQGTGAEGNLSESSSQGNDSDLVGIPGYHTKATIDSQEERSEGSDRDTSGLGEDRDEDVEMGGVCELEVERGGTRSPGPIGHTHSDDQAKEESVAEHEEYEPAGAEEGNPREWTRINKSSEELLDHYSYFYGI
ncbi:uncharacterized protein PAC_04941 [Phialocephala subalpina]|uniref:Uncharacterized protein n=1 Tax=Phialocephala subalpina TaxID=576137 RepID=A0A1L7WQL1_9HELO|nr:uncharacterized protein PAC_04941 [Phialocephala subalpina]